MPCRGTAGSIASPDDQDLRLTLHDPLNFRLDTVSRDNGYEVGRGTFFKLLLHLLQTFFCLFRRKNTGLAVDNGSDSGHEYPIKKGCLEVPSMDSGVILKQQGVRLHSSEGMLVDDQWVFFGSVNFICKDLFIGFAISVYCIVIVC